MASPSAVYDVAVVGAGIIGSWTAHALAEKGVNTVLLEQVNGSAQCTHYGTHPLFKEQFCEGHQRNSSSGYSRITRRAYAQGYYVEMMTEANRTWEEMEKQTKAKLYVYVCFSGNQKAHILSCSPTGILIFGEKNCQNDLGAVISALEKFSIPYQVN